MQNLLANAKANIEKVRKKEMTVKVVRDGKPVEGCNVSVSQKKHEFLFGANCFQVTRFDPQQLEQYTKLFTDIFNYTTLPVYWGFYEPEKGNTQKGEDNLRKLLEWCDEHGLERKGHPLHWHEPVPKWLPDEDPNNHEELIINRVANVVETFKDRIKLWDVVNEITRAYEFKDPISLWEMKKGWANVVRTLVELVHGIDPQAKLLLNECNLWNGAFEELLRVLKDSGVALYAVGIQSHMHSGTWTVERTWEICEKFSRFGWPVHFTELSILSGKCETKVDWYSRDGNVWIIKPEDEDIQAQQVRDIYTILFSHPAVEAVTWWDIVDGNWLRAPSGLLTAELAPKKAYYALKDLVTKEWWTQTNGLTDKAGEFKTSAFYGEYEINITVGDKSISRSFNHLKGNAGESAMTIDLNK